jgi:hypothetical protein
MLADRVSRPADLKLTDLVLFAAVTNWTSNLLGAY